MLPWENLPILRNQEVYRMPSVSSISAVLDKGNNHNKQVGRNLVTFPSIDPMDAFYLLNPDGDLRCTQLEFENYFRDQNLQVFHLFEFDKNTREELLQIFVILLVTLSINLVIIYIFFSIMLLDRERQVLSPPSKNWFLHWKVMSFLYILDMEVVKLEKISKIIHNA